jgi:hypothetical protein
MAPMMTPLLTRRGSCRLRSDDFISPPPPPLLFLLVVPQQPPAGGAPTTAQIWRACAAAPSGRPPLVRPPLRRGLDLLSPRRRKGSWQGNGNEGGRAWTGEVAASKEGRLEMLCLADGGRGKGETDRS